MAWFWWLLGVFVVVIWIATVVDIIRRRHTRTGAKTAAWILLVIILPIVGSITYFLVNGVASPSAPRDADLDHVTGRRF
jgi:ABC-type phosphate transport system permease subunit